MLMRVTSRLCVDVRGVKCNHLATNLPRLLPINTPRSWYPVFITLPPFRLPTFKIQHLQSDRGRSRRFQVRRNTKRNARKNVARATISARCRWSVVRKPVNTGSGHWPLTTEYRDVARATIGEEYAVCSWRKAVKADLANFATV